MPKDLLTKTGRYFRICLTGPFREAESRRVKINDVPEEIFSNFLNWLFSGDFVGLKREGAPDAEGDGRMAEIVGLFIFGDRIQCERLVNHLIEMMREVIVGGQELVDIESVYRNTVADHPLRNYMALHVAASIGLGEIDLGSLNSLGDDTKTDLLLRVVEQTARWKNEYGGMWPLQQVKDYFVYFKI